MRWGPILLLFLGATAARADEKVFDVRAWKVVDSQSGSDNYYKVMTDPAGPYIRATYKPGMDTTLLGYELPEAIRKKAHKLRWTWRAISFPKCGDKCSSAPDAAATVYVSWKRGLKWYTLKYQWSTAVPKGTICDNKRNPFVAQDAITVETGGPPGVWMTEEIDLQKEFRKRFADNDPEADVPDWKGVAIMTDGDQTQTDSIADYGTFVVTY